MKSCRARIEYNELPAKATVFSDRPRGTERAKQINARRGINHLPAETKSLILKYSKSMTTSKSFEISFHIVGPQKDV